MESSASELDQFREQWREEISQSCGVSRTATGSAAADSHQSTVIAGARVTGSSADSAAAGAVSPAETGGACQKASRANQAVQLYLAAMELERQGDVHGALRQYRRAVQCDAAVEQHVAGLTLRQSADTAAEQQSAVGRTAPAADTAGNTATGASDSRSPVGCVDGRCSSAVFAVADSVESLPLMDVGSLAGDLQRLTIGGAVFCSPQTPCQGMHIGQLPAELVLQLLGWLVSAQLDIVSLERLARVSRGFYLHCRNQQLWRRICLRSSVAPSIVAESPLIDWRALYYRSPHLRFDGCYVARACYVRRGDCGGFHDSSQCAWQMVVHYRLLRFGADGGATMTLGPAEASGAAALLHGSGGATVSGHYRLQGNRVLITLRKARKEVRKCTRRGRREKVAYDPGEQCLHLDLAIESLKNGVQRLVWNSYTIVTRYRGDHSDQQLEVASCRQRVHSVAIDDQMPALVFTRVPAYLARGQRPLP